MFPRRPGIISSHQSQHLCPWWSQLGMWETQVWAQRTMHTPRTTSCTQSRWNRCSKDIMTQVAWWSCLLAQEPDTWLNQLAQLTKFYRWSQPAQLSKEENIRPTRAEHRNDTTAWLSICGSLINHSPVTGWTRPMKTIPIQWKNIWRRHLWGKPWVFHQLREQKVQNYQFNRNENN